MKVALGEKGSWGDGQEEGETAVEIYETRIILKFCTHEFILSLHSLRRFSYFTLYK